MKKRVNDFIKTISERRFPFFRLHILIMFSSEVDVGLDFLCDFFARPRNNSYFQWFPSRMKENKRDKPANLHKNKRKYASTWFVVVVFTVLTRILEYEMLDEIPREKNVMEIRHTHTHIKCRLILITS